MRRLSAAALAMALLCGCVSEIARRIDDWRVGTRIGVMAHVDIGPGGNPAAFEKALRYYRQNKVSAVVIVGPVLRTRADAKTKTLDDVWRETFGGEDVLLVTEDGPTSVGDISFAVSTARPHGACDVLTFYGDRKYALTDELCLYPRDAKAVCAGSMCGVDVPEGFGDKGLRTAAAQAAQGLLVSAYDGKTVIRRLDFTQRAPVDPSAAFDVRRFERIYAEEVAEPWELKPGVPVALPGEVPEFWADTRILALPGFRNNERVVTVKWPSVLQGQTGARARWYEVAVAFAHRPNEPFCRKSVMSNGFFLSEDRDRKGVQCIFGEAEFPSAEDGRRAIVFSVTPVGCFGKRGKAVFSEAVSLRPKE